MGKQLAWCPYETGPKGKHKHSSRKQVMACIKQKNKPTAKWKADGSGIVHGGKK